MSRLTGLVIKFSSIILVLVIAAGCESSTARPGKDSDNGDSDAGGKSGSDTDTDSDSDGDLDSDAGEDDDVCDAQDGIRWRFDVDHSRIGTERSAYLIQVAGIHQAYLDPKTR